MNNLGTWIDWQYLQNAAKLLAKVCTPHCSDPGIMPGPARPRPLKVGAIVAGRGFSALCSPAHFISLSCAHSGPRPQLGARGLQEEDSTAFACEQN